MSVLCIVCLFCIVLFICAVAPERNDISHTCVWMNDNNFELERKKLHHTLKPHNTHNASIIVSVPTSPKLNIICFIPLSHHTCIHTTYACVIGSNPYHQHRAECLPMASSLILSHRWETLTHFTAWALGGHARPAKGVMEEAPCDTGKGIALQRCRSCKSFLCVHVCAWSVFWKSSQRKGIIA